MKQLKIGNIILENSYILGPMAGVNGRARPFAV